MKNLKFRAWIEKTKYMAIQGTPDLETFQSFMFHFCDEKKLMQFTGLIDKNGIEIYEGDLLIDREFDENGSDISSNLEVLFDEKTAQFVLDNSFSKNKSSLVNIIEYLGQENLQVVGNIYEKLE